MERKQSGSPAPAPGRPAARLLPRHRPVLATAVAIAMVIAAIVPLSSCSSTDGEVSTTVTTALPTTTSATAPITTVQPATTLPPTTLPPTSTTAPPPTTAPPSAGAPGDSAGSWAETQLPAAPSPAHSVSVSDQALLVAARTDAGASLWAYLFDQDKSIELPVSGSDVFQTDIDGLLAVWWQDQHIYAYLLPDGPKIDVTGDRPDVSYPQIAGSWITWTQGTPSEDLPDEYWRMPIFGVEVDSQGAPLGEPVELMGSVVAAVAGDSFFTYALSETHLAWEQGRAAGDLALGTHVMDLETLQPSSLGKEAWRPSLGDDTLVYYENGLKARDLATGEVREIDPRGDYATATPSFAAYFRTSESSGGYEIVARGLTGGYEQMLGVPTEPPYLSPAIAASTGYVAFITGGSVRLFTWQGR